MQRKTFEGSNQVALAPVPSTILCLILLPIHLISYFHLWAQRDLNPRPIDYESTALTN